MPSANDPHPPPDSAVAYAGRPPYRSYAEPERARLELANVLLPSWQLVCHVSDLPSPGTAARFDCAGHSAVVLRGRDGALRAFRNVCSHRGSRIVDGDVHTGLAFCVDARLRCPYHGWAYDHDGALAELPHEHAYPGLDRSTLRLQALPIETWLGWVFVAFAAPPARVADALRGCEHELLPHRLDALRRIGEPRVRRVRADWKTALEHWLDVGHLAIARPGLKPVVGHAREFTPCGPQVMRMAVDVCSESASNWSSRAYSRWLPEQAALPAERRRRVFSYFIWPNLALHVSPDQVVVAQVLPAGPGACEWRHATYALPDGARQMRLARYVHQRIQRAARREDARLAERLQAGRESGDCVPGPTADDEIAVRWFTSRVLAAFPEPARGDEPSSRARRRSSRAR